MHVSTCYSQCTCTCPLASPYACTPVCSSRALERSCLIANCITTTFDYVIKTQVVMYVVQCINLWFTNMKQEENMVHPWHVNAASVDSPVCPVSPCWCHLLCSLMPSLVLVDAVSRGLSSLMPSLVVSSFMSPLVVSPHWCRFSSPHVPMNDDSYWWFFSDIFCPSNKIQYMYFFLYSKSPASCSSEFTRMRHSRMLCNHTCHACLKREICKHVPHKQTLLTCDGRLPFRTSVL